MLLYPKAISPPVSARASICNRADRGSGEFDGFAGDVFERGVFVVPTGCSQAFFFQEVNDFAVRSNFPEAVGVNFGFESSQEFPDVGRGFPHFTGIQDSLRIVAGGPRICPPGIRGRKTKFSASQTSPGLLMVWE